MRRLTYVLLAALATPLFAAPPATRPADATTAADVPLDRLVNRLADDDPLVRRHTANELLALGRAARPALVDAVNSDDPQLRLSAADVLLKLPFDLPGDPPGVAALLRKYADPSPVNRAGALKPIADAAGPDLAPLVLLRLIREEPSDTVRWAIVGQFRALGRAHLPPPAALDPAPTRAPNLALAAWATEKHDYPAAVRLYRRCMDAESRHPTDDANGQSDFVFDTLLNVYFHDRRFDQCAAVYRAQYRRRPETIEDADGTSNKLDDLFALHAEYGPLPGFASDVGQHPAHLARPQVMYALARLHARQGRPLLADALNTAAFAASLGSSQQRGAVGEFLVAHRWNDFAERELRALLAVETDPASVHFANGHLRLGLLLARQGDDAGAAEHKRAAMEALGANGGNVTRVKGDRRYTGKEAEDLMWAEVHWHAFRAARDKGDATKSNQHLDDLAKYAPDDEQIALDAVPALLQADRRADAVRLFAKPYATLKRLAAESPDDPERLNNLAWLCARSAMNLEEADQLITRAMQLKPDNYAYLDTAAEIQFQLKNYAKAIELESRAIQLHPNDPFLEDQLQRFRAAQPKK